MTHAIDTHVVEGLQDMGRYRVQSLVQATANSTLTLTVASQGYLLFTGTIAGQIVKMGAANTYLVGHTYLIHNNSTQRITVQDNAGTVICTVYPNYRVVFVLQDNSTAAGIWVFGLSTSKDSFWVFENGLLTWADGTGADLMIAQYGGSGSAYVRQMSANGTPTAPLPVTNGQRLGGYGYYGYNSGGPNGMPSAEDLIIASEDHTPTAWGGDRTWNTIENGTVASVERMRLFNSGEFKVLSSVESLRQVSTVTTTPTTLNGNYNLTNTSGSLQVITGTATGFDVNLPNATTLLNGLVFEILNTSTQSITIDNNADTLLLTLQANSKARFRLVDNATTNGTWVVETEATNVTDYDITSSTSFSGGFNTDTVITGFTITPPAGTYEGSFSLSITCGSTSARVYTASFYAGGTLVADSPRRFQAPASNAAGHITSNSKITVNGAQAIDVRVKVNNTSGGTITVTDRHMTLRRVGA